MKKLENKVINRNIKINMELIEYNKQLYLLCSAKKDDLFIIDYDRKHNHFICESLKSNNISTNFKFEQVKKYVRLFIERNPSEADFRCMNNNYSIKAIKLIIKYNNILKRSKNKNKKESIFKLKH